MSLMSPISVLLRYFARKSAWCSFDWENYEQSSNLLLLGGTNVSETCKTTNIISSTCYTCKIGRPILGTGIKNTSVYRSQLLGAVYDYVKLSRKLLYHPGNCSMAILGTTRKLNCYRKSPTRNSITRTIAKFPNYLWLGYGVVRNLVSMSN